MALGLWQAVLALACGSEDAGGGPIYEDPRSLDEICATYCDNAERNGCPDLSGSNCLATCNFVPLTFSGDCLRTYINHGGCLADVPNVCDGEQRDAYCLDEYCLMRRTCDLPDPRCR